MTLRALILLVWVLLSPEAIGALGQICEAEIISGAMDLTEPMSGMIYAVGKKNGQTWQIEAIWSNGLPKAIIFSSPQGDS